MVLALQEAGYNARHVAQEHSYVPHMWQRICQPDVLIYLDVNYDAIKARQPRLDFRPEHLEEQKRRLAHARKHSHLYLNTNDMDPSEVRDQALMFLEQLGLKP